MAATTVRPSRGLPTRENPATPDDASGDKAALATRVRTGSLWNAGSNVLLRLSNVLVMAVVARLVAPRELGVFALAAALQVLLADLAALGVASAIARADLDADELAPTVVSMSIGSTFLLAALMSSFAVPLAALLGAPDAAGPIRVLAISIAVMGVFAVPAAQLQRDFRQDALFRANLISFLPSSVVLILLAGVGGGAMAFAWSRVAGALAVGYVMLRNVDRKYWPGLNWSYVRPLLHFGLPLALANVLSQVLLNVDYVFVGRVMSTADVGLYMLAFTICTWPTALLGPLLNNMVLPAFSRLKRDGGELASALSYAVRTVMLIACPIAAFTCAFSTPLINTVYGSKWAAAGPVLSVLSLYGIVFVLGLLFANIIISTGRTVVLFAVQVAALLGLLPALAVGVHTGGLVGIGVAHILVISLITLPTYLAAVRKSTGVGPLPVLRAVVRPLSAAVMAVLVGRLGTLTVQVDALRLLAGGTVVAIVYVLLTGSLLVQLLPTRLRPAGATHRLLHLVVRRRIHEGGE